jgi:peptidoglycan hydrolase-like protein with peptidoglycan-binding domain
MLAAILMFTAISSATTSKKKHHRPSATGHTQAAAGKAGAASSTQTKAADAQAKAAASTASARSTAGLHAARTNSYRPGASHAKSKKQWRGPVPRAPRTHAAVHHGQHGIQDERALEIQQALIREKYLEGEPSGSWDQRTREAMTRFQNDHGWQSKVVPDSRALIKLGLGPKHDDLLNPEAVNGPGVLPNSAGDLQPGGAGAKR